MTMPIIIFSAVVVLAVVLILTKAKRPTKGGSSGVAGPGPDNNAR